MWKGDPDIDFKTEWQNQKLTFIWLRCNPTTSKNKSPKKDRTAKTHMLMDTEQTM